MLLSGLAACTTTSGGENDTADVNNTTKFASADYGVKASPRVTTSKKVNAGGGRYQVGKPYEVAGRWYHPKVNKHYSKAGLASWYGPNFHGRLTANGEVYDQYSLSAAHPTLPLPCYARVTNKTTGDSVIVRVNDRGPFAKGRIIDLSNEAAKMLHMRLAGVAKVQVKYVGMAPLDGDDASYLMASYRAGADGSPAVDPDTGRADVMLAMNSTEGPLPGVANDDAAAVPAPRASGESVASAMVDGHQDLTPAQQSIQSAIVPSTVPVPVPMPRPTRTASLGTERVAPDASAYRSRADEATPDVFDKVLAEQDRGLTEQSIVRSWNNRLVAQN